MFHNVFFGIPVSNLKLENRRYDAVIFDIDNVIVDTRFSYTDCIRETVQTYLEKNLGYKPSKAPFLTQKDVETFKLLGGFNDDWDTCYGILTYLLSLKPKEKSVVALKRVLDFDSLAATIRPLIYVNGIERLFGKSRSVNLKKIAWLFQKLYRSKYIHRETLLIRKAVFKNLAGRGIKIGIATGRNKREAHFAFKRFGISRWIDKMVTVDSLPDKKFKKPHPYSLLEIARGFGRRLRYLYIGDLPDDMSMAREAAKQIDITAWGFCALSEDNRSRAMLKNAGAEKVISSVSELNRLLAQI